MQSSAPVRRRCHESRVPQSQHTILTIYTYNKTDHKTVPGFILKVSLSMLYLAVPSEARQRLKQQAGHLGDGSILRIGFGDAPCNDVEILKVKVSEERECPSTLQLWLCSPVKVLRFSRSPSRNWSSSLTRGHGQNPSTLESGSLHSYMKGCIGESKRRSGTVAIV